MQLTYRPEIDGLRTIAVLAVLLYHAQFTLAGAQLLPGGFLGVDVFFVISGYLITSIIVAEFRTSGKFSVSNFYERRARRLLPALLIVMVAALPVGWLLLLPSQLLDMAKSLIASLFFGSNFYWHFTTQAYGAESALLKPFLHTWSLAVEEQYYILFPFLLVGLYRWRERLVIPVLFFTCLLSLLFAQWMTQQDQSLSFYLLPSRLWELLAGGLLAHVASRRALQPTWANRIMPTLGLTLICFSLATIKYGDGHPGFITVIPVLGTMLLIHFCGSGDWVTRLLASPLFVGVGLVSYSLYLWHYPIFAFGRIMESDPALGSKVLWIAFSFGLSVGSYFLLEKPFRNRTRLGLKPMAASLAIASLLVIAACLYIVENDGVEGRLHKLDALYGQNEYDNAKLRRQSWAILEEIAGTRSYSPSLPGRPSLFEQEGLWFVEGHNSNNVLVVGDSRSKDIFNTIHLNRSLFPNIQPARFGMGSQISEQHLVWLEKSSNYAQANTLILSFQSDSDTLARLPKLIETALADGKKVVITSRSPTFREASGKPVFDWYIQSRNTANPYSSAELNRHFYNRLMRHDEKIDKQLREISSRYDLRFLDRTNIVCDRDQKSCAATTPDGYKTYYDNLHWTVEGARYFGQEMIEQLRLDQAEAALKRSSTIASDKINPGQ
jgi:peptidoglycan/LPS O-acetylase OafA/YrhL